MGFLRNAIRSGITAKAVQIVMREMKKPENQRKAREMAQNLRKKQRRRTL